MKRNHDAINEVALDLKKLSIDLINFRPNLF